MSNTHNQNNNSAEFNRVVDINNSISTSPSETRIEILSAPQLNNNNLIPISENNSNIQEQSISNNINNSIQQSTIDMYSTNPTQSPLDNNDTNNATVQRQPNINLSAFILRNTSWSSLQNVFQGVRRPSVQLHNLRIIERNLNTPIRHENNISSGIRLEQGHSHHHHLHHHHFNFNRAETGVSSPNYNQNHIEEPTLPRRTPLQERVANLQRNDPPDLLPNQRRNNGGNDSNDDFVAEIFAQLPEPRSVMNMLVRYVPFVCILLVKSTYDHVIGLTALLVLSSIFLHSNSLLRDQITKQTSRSIKLLISELIYVYCPFYVIFTFIDKQILYGLLPINIKMDFKYTTITLSQLLFSVALTDLLLKLATIAVKIFITLLPPTIIKYKRRGRIYALIEGFSQFYRSLTPITLWLVFLLNSYTEMEKVLGVLFSAVYIIRKAIDVYERGKFCQKVFVNFMKKVSYGREPTTEELQTASQCPICHDDFDTPVILECKHVFCELCVGTWFTREQTCPLCRAKVADDPAWQDGATTFFVQLY